MTMNDTTRILDDALATTRTLLARRAIYLDSDCTDSDFFEAIRDSHNSRLHDHLDPTMRELLHTYDCLLQLHPFPPTYEQTCEDLEQLLFRHHLGNPRHLLTS
jgi:hypothetical protein